jgi:hypothetical protein
MATSGWDAADHSTQLRVVPSTAPRLIRYDQRDGLISGSRRGTLYLGGSGRTWSVPTNLQPGPMTAKLCNVAIDFTVPAFCQKWPVRLTGTENRHKAIQKPHAKVGLLSGLRPSFMTVSSSGSTGMGEWGSSRSYAKYAGMRIS